MQDYFLSFQGFTPSEFTRRYLDLKLGQLQEEAPYGSLVRATFSRHDDRLKGIVRIESKAGRFVAVSSGRRFKDVSRKLMSQIRRQLERWRTLRFNSNPNQGGSYETNTAV